MELYTLDRHFLPSQSIGQFTSVIWTERYSSAGEVQLVVPATPSMADILTQGTFLGLRGTKEIMVIETQSIEKGLLTATGSSLVRFLNNREAWFPNPAYDGSDTSVALAAEYTNDTLNAGGFLADVLNRTVISPASFGSYWTPIDLDWANDAIPGLALGVIDGNGVVKRLTFPLGPLYDGIQNLATDQRLGFKLYLESSILSAGTWILKFATYRGKNRTSEQVLNRMVRLTPQMDSLLDPKEVVSAANYKNVVYVSYKNVISTHYIGATVPTAFDRRVIRVEAPNIYLDPSHIAAFREQVAYNAFMQHAYISAVDGQVSSQPGYKFEKDYYLGDVIELEGTTGLRSVAQVTEYIRAQDRYGVKEYPTLTVLDPLLFDFEADLEPDPDFDFDWTDDPDFEFDFPPLDDSGFDDPEWPDFEFPDFEMPDFKDDHTTDPHKKKRRRKTTTGADVPADPKDHDPDPDPDLTPPEHIYGPARLITGYYPDQDNGEAIGKITTDGELGPLWIFITEGPTDGFVWEDLIPLGWTTDKTKIVARSDDSNDDFNGIAYWSMNPDGTGRTRLTQTFERGNILDSPGVYHSWDIGYGAESFWAGPSNARQLIVNRVQGSPQEYLYADGTYSSDPTLHNYTYAGDPPMKIREHPTIDDPGPGIATGSPIDTYRTTDGNISGLSKIFGVEDFSAQMRWVKPTFQISPDGSKLFIERGTARPGGGWIIDSSMYGISGGSFRIAVGKFGDYFGGIYTSPIPYDATVEQIWIAVVTAGHAVWEFAYGAGTKILDDPRDYGYPYTPYYAGGLLKNGYQQQIVFQNLAPEGTWMDMDADNLIAGGPGGPGGASVRPWQGFSSWPGGHRYLCNSDGSDLTEIDLGPGDIYNRTWLPDSSKIFISRSGTDPLIYYDIASGDITPLTGLFNPDTEQAWELVFSPDSTKIAYVVQKLIPGVHVSLWVASIDGSDATKIYEQPVDYDEADQDILVLPTARNAIKWSFDGTKLALIDSRDSAPVWIINVSTGVLTKVFAGTGWDNPDDQKWLYDLVNFDG